MSEHMGSPRVSFVIPVKNDADRLRHCLATIVANLYPPVAVEIIVADNGSSDRSAAGGHGGRRQGSVRAWLSSVGSAESGGRRSVWRRHRVR